MKLALLVTLLISASCASVHPGNLGSELQNKKEKELVVSAELVSEFSDPTLSFIAITMENTSDEWIRIKSAEFSCGEACNQKVQVLVGNDLVVWAKAKSDKMEIEEQNKKMILGGLTAGGVLMAILAKDQNTATVGAAVATGASIGSVATDINNAKNALENPNWVPAEHVFSPATVPTSLFTRKWILVNHPKNFDIGAFILRLKTVEGEELSYAFKI